MGKDYYTRIGRTYVTSGNPLVVESSLPLSFFDLPDFLQSGDRISSNFLYDLTNGSGSYFLNAVKTPNTGEEDDGRNVGINNLWNINWNYSQRKHELYTWTGVFYTGSGLIDGTGPVVGVTGLTDYSGIYYFDDAVVSPAYDENYKISQVTTPITSGNLTGTGIISELFFENAESGIIDYYPAQHPSGSNSDIDIQDAAWINYNTSGIDNKVVKGLGITVRFSEDILSAREDNNLPGTVIDPVIEWGDVGFICDLNSLKDGFVKEAEEEEETEEENLCSPPLFCGEDVGGGGFDDSSTNGGGGGGGGGEEKSFSGVLYSGTIFINNLEENGYVKFSPYNFDYSGSYSGEYGSSFPSENNLDKTFIYSQNTGSLNFKNAYELADLFNENFNAFVDNSGIWQWFKTGLQEFSSDTSGDFYYGPLLEASAVNRNIVNIKSLVLGEMGNYKISTKKSELIEEGGSEKNRYQYSLPNSIYLQGKNSGQGWKTLFQENFELNGGDHTLLDGYKIEKSEEYFSDFPYVQIENDRNGRDAFIIQSVDNTISSGGSGLSDVFSTKTNISNFGANPFESTSFPTGINMSDFSTGQISLAYSGNSTGELLGYITGYTFTNPNPTIELEDLINANFLRECPEPVTVTRTKSTVISSGIDENGNYFTITSESSADCSGCDGYNLQEVPEGHPINSGLSPSNTGYLESGWVECPSEDLLDDLLDKDSKDKPLLINYSGFFTGHAGDQFFPTGNIPFTGFVSYKKDIKPLFEIPNSIAIYQIVEQSNSFGDFNFKTTPEDVLSKNEVSNSIVSYRTGYFIENEKQYDDYRFLIKDYYNSDVLSDHILKTGNLIIEEINLYGPTNYVHNLTGQNEITLYDATYSGDLQVFTTGYVTGTHTGSSISGILNINTKKTGELVSDLFYKGEQIYPVQPFFATYKDTATGIGNVTIKKTGLFYDTDANRVTGELEFTKLITGNDFISGSLNRINSVLDISDATDELIYIDETRNSKFTGVGFINAFQSGIPSFTIESGVLTGSIPENSGEFTFNLSKSGLYDSVLSSFPSGYINASATLNYNHPVINDSIRVNGVNFNFGNSNSSPDTFNDITGLKNIINSGDYNYTASILDTETLLFNSAIPGESGNSLVVSSIGSTGKPTFETSTFTGGQNLYQELSGYDIFTGKFSNTIKNTGVYSVDYSGSITGTISIYTGDRYFTDVWNLYSGKYSKDYDFKFHTFNEPVTYTGTPVVYNGSTVFGPTTGVDPAIGTYQSDFNNFGRFPGKFSLYVDYNPGTFIVAGRDVARITVTGVNLSGFTTTFNGGAL